MYTIILDSSNTSLTVALAKDNALIDYVSYEAWQEQSEHMIPELDGLLNKHNVDKKNIADVMVSIGPGSYTGVRISLTIAKTLAVALNIPVYTLSSLQVLKDNDECSICLINARSNRSYIGVYNNEQVLLKDCIMTNEDVLTYINEHPEYKVCGNTKYLGIDGINSNIALQMLSLKPFIKPVEDALGIKPIYMKD